MNIKELDRFKISDAVNFHKELNPQIFDDEMMRPDVHKRLETISRHFMEFLGVDNIALVDITVSGSNAAYSYTPHSDIDLHLVVNFQELDESEIYRELFDAKKYEYNDKHDIKVKGYEVEVYVQDSNQKHISLGEYSILRNEWNKVPSTITAVVDDDNTKLKYNKIKSLAIRALASDDKEYLKDVLSTIGRYRKAGLDAKGEFGPENLAFKVLRKHGYFDRLWEKHRELVSRELSLENELSVQDEINTEFELFEKLQQLKKDNPTKAMFTTINNGELDFNVVEYQIYKYADKTRINKGFSILETFDNKVIKKTNDLFNSIESDEPVLNESYHILELMCLSDGLLIQIGEKSLSKITKIQNKTYKFGDENKPYTEFTVLTSDGRTKIFPQEFEREGAMAKTFFLKDQNEFEKLRTTIQIYFSEWRISNQLKEDGRIVQGVNTTQDVGTAEIKIQSKKMGFDVTTGGVPALLKTSGEHPSPMVVESKRHHIPGWDYDRSLFTYHDSEFGEVFDVGKLYEAYHFYLNKNNLFEGAGNEFNSLVNGLVGESNPLVGKYYSLIMVTQISQDNISIDGHKTPSKLLSFNGNTYTFKVNGIAESYPKQSSGWMNFKTVLYSSKEELEKALSFLSLKGDNFSNHLAEEKLNELKMGPKHLSNEVQKLLKIVAPIIGIEFEVCKQPSDDIDDTIDKEIDSFMDIADFEIFFNQNDEDDFEKLLLPYRKWLSKKDPAYADMSLDEIRRDNGDGVKSLTSSTFGAFVKDNGYSSMMEFFDDNRDWLEEPYSDRSSESYSVRDAKETAEEMDDYGMTADVEEQYHSGNRGDNWVIEPDDSIRPNPGDIGMEIISPPMEYEDGILHLQDMLSMFQNGAYYTNDSTGLHINVSVEGMGFSRLDYVKLVLLAGDKTVLQQFDRELNNYTSNAVEGLSDYFRGSSVQILEVFKAMREGIDNLGADLIGNISLGGHVSIEIKHGYIEFRSAGGDYIHSGDEIINTINRFIVAYSAAMSPELHRKEYAKKLYKLISVHLPGGRNRNIQHAMQLFAMNQAGMVDKNRLKEKLKDLQGARRVEQEFSAEGLLAEKILKINPSMSNAQVLTIIRKGIKIESQRVPENQVTTEVYNNLMKSLDFYHGMDRVDVMNYLEDPSSWS